MRFLTSAASYEQLILQHAEVDEAFTLITGIKGIAEASAIQILGELLILPKDMNAKQWVAYAGLDPRHFERLLLDFDTLILLKVKPLLDDVIELLLRRQLLEHSWFIEKAGAPEERVVHDVASLQGQKVNYLSLMIIKNPNRQRSEMQRGCRKKKETTDE